jgi:hypothetical protein
MDVALHPDSKEGQTLLNYLRQAGIPFMAFRGAVSGAATGAHIHIGNPSPVIGKSGLSSGGKAISNGPVSKSALRKGQ